MFSTALDQQNVARFSFGARKRLFGSVEIAMLKLDISEQQSSLGLL